MQRGKWFVFAAMLLIAATAFASIGKVPIKNLPVRGGSHDTELAVSVAPDQGPVRGSALDEVIGDTLTAGFTWYDYQHNGTAGRMIYTDVNGFVHVVWMRGLTSNPAGARHAYYNVWDPSTNSFLFMTGSLPTGQLVNSSNRAGYVNVCGLPDGWVFPGFHEIAGSDPNAHSAAAMDFQPGTGAFTTRQATPYWVEQGENVELIWPKTAIGRDSTIHMISTENPNVPEPAGHWQRIVYSRGTPMWDQDGYGVRVNWDTFNNGTAYLEIDTAMVIAPMIVTSKVSDRVAIVWSKSRDDLLEADPGPTQYNNDLYYVLSEDGGLNWQPEVNVTNFAYPDEDCVSQDTAVCDRDTFRVYTDCSALFDLEDNLHLAFTTCTYYSLEGLIGVVFSYIWHWDAEIQEFSPIAAVEFDSTTWTLPTPAAGAWQRAGQRPCLSLDEETGYLYCSYQRYDNIYISEAGYPQGDALVSFSRNCGRTWSEGTYVTLTHSVDEAAPAGQSLSERDITINDKITYQDGVGYIDMLYVLDLDAGAVIQDPAEGVATNNPVKFQRISIDDLPWTANDWTYPAMRYDSTGFPGSNVPLDPDAVSPCPTDAIGDEHSSLRPESFKLYQNYPNPFNPTTEIQFDLVRDARVTMNVYNVMGQIVATLYNGQMLSAGAQTTRFDASNLTSGVYVYRIEVDGVTASMKMVLMK